MKNSIKQAKEWFEQQYKEMKNNPGFEFIGLLLQLGEDISIDMIDEKLTSPLIARKIGVKLKAVNNIRRAEDKVTLDDLCKVMEHYGYKIEIKVLKKGNKVK